jgi:hypothetical protein
MARRPRAARGRSRVAASSPGDEPTVETVEEELAEEPEEPEQDQAADEPEQPSELAEEPEVPGYPPGAIEVLEAITYTAKNGARRKACEGSVVHDMPDHVALDAEERGLVKLLR